MTEGNKEQYLDALSTFRLVKQPKKQIQAFMKGMESYTENHMRSSYCLSTRFCDIGSSRLNSNHLH